MIDLGHVSEQNTRQYTFPVGNLIAKYPDCTPFVLHRRAGTVDAVPVANATLDGNRLVWHFTATDTELDGDGECWLVMKSADGSQKWISDPMPTHLDKSYTVGEAPSDPVKSWLDAVLERIASFELKAAEVKTYSEIAKTYVESASQQAKNAAESAEEAYDAERQAFDSAVQSATFATESKRYSDVALEKANAAQAAASAAGNSLLELLQGIQSGDFKGDKGDKGDEGERGPAGPAGSDATVTKAAINSALGVDVPKKLGELQGDYEHQQEQIASKLTKPETVAVGKYFRVAAIDEAGNPVLEAVDLPIAGSNMPGVVKTSYWGGILTSDGTAYVYGADKGVIDAKNNQYRPINPNYLDYAIRAGLLSNKEIADADKPKICETIGAVPYMPTLQVDSVIEFDGTNGTVSYYYVMTEKPIVLIDILIDRSACQGSRSGTAYFTVGDKSMEVNDDNALSTWYALYSNAYFVSEVNRPYGVGFPQISFQSTDSIYSIEANVRANFNRFLKWMSSQGTDSRIMNLLRLCMKYTGEKAYIKVWTM